MEKIGLLTRERIVEQLKKKIKDASGCFFVGFNKVNAFSFNNLRNDLKKSQTEVFVAKNSLFKKTFNELGIKDVDDFLDAETGAVLVYDKDVVKTCKALVDFAKESETLKLKGGILNERKINSKELSALAKLPSKEILLGHVVSAVASPLTGFLTGLNQVILKFVWVVEEIKNKKQ